MNFTLCEILLVVFILSISLRMFLSLQVESKNEPALLEYQLNAMEHLETVPIHENHWFNENGNINKAGTFRVNKYTCVIQLGFGRYQCD
ncbi:competence protein ComGD [Erysipelothrix rhusiopathiae]|uniref:competence protein ComGD n=1 Tax=Erysipelothrix rhusiopathiae TaxID=1648 RepID=UPI000F42EC40|nr:competence protein ComGD [Erysipelothrix rhusiopathiae]AYV34532.1 competence protein ComGD [Erysipelothrix rhusiopathiae]MDE8081137.1 competence protein ComGD [Erysipelothrix rhusiopathiae]MDE8314443.1 competence protein ComGD [Erysipelothrix rhusiopathiae]MDE8329349.1 competence protein ComGD [Erysipelothrix rhusiopathiae]